MTTETVTAPTDNELAVALVHLTAKVELLRDALLELTRDVDDAHGGVANINDRLAVVADILEEDDADA